MMRPLEELLTPVLGGLRASSAPTCAGGPLRGCDPLSPRLSQGGQDAGGAGPQGRYLWPRHLSGPSQHALSWKRVWEVTPNSPPGHLARGHEGIWALQGSSQPAQPSLHRGPHLSWGGPSCPVLPPTQGPEYPLIRAVTTRTTVGCRLSQAHARCRLGCGSPSGLRVTVCPFCALGPSSSISAWIMASPSSRRI